MPYNFVADGFHTKKLGSKLSWRKVHFLTENDHFVFYRPLWGLQATYAVHLNLIGKRVVDFLLVIIELFSPVFMAEVLRAKAKIDRKSALSKERGQFGPKFQVQRGIPRRPFFLSKH